MFYKTAKFLWAFATPSNLLGLMLAVAGLGLFTRFADKARWLVAAAAFFYLLCGFGPIGAMLLRPLEDRFPPPPADLQAPDGIVVLGGGIDDEVTAARGVPTFNRFGARITAAAALARRFPQARLIYTGGSAQAAGRFSNEVETAKALFLDLGVAADRLSFESRSRDTYENAIFTRELLRPRSESRWLLVTSAFHMPRAMATFRAAGFTVVAFPADYLTLGDARDFLSPQLTASLGLEMTELGLHEWVGLLAYRLAGRTRELLP